jgi:hypothetical protein
MYVSLVYFFILRTPLSLAQFSQISRISKRKQNGKCVQVRLFVSTRECLYYTSCTKNSAHHPWVHYAKCRGIYFQQKSLERSGRCPLACVFQLSEVLTMEYFTVFEHPLKFWIMFIRFLTLGQINSYMADLITMDCTLYKYCIVGIRPKIGFPKPSKGVWRVKHGFPNFRNS